jgi:ribosomal-protein-alanine N-acetyltransferase
MPVIPAESAGVDLAFRRLSGADRDSVMDLFAAIRVDPDRRLFRPHPFEVEDADRIVALTGRDLHVGGFLGPLMVTYGMLRGWDEGFKIPSLGLYVRTGYRGTGAGRRTLDHLHRLAREHGADRVRLTVDHENSVARGLYERSGYVFQPLDPLRWVGLKSLP